MAFLLKAAVAMAAGRVLRRVMEGAGDVEREARETAGPAPHEAIDEEASARMACREIAFEILGRKQGILDAKFNGRRQSMESLFEEMRTDSDQSDVPKVFDYLWDEASGDFVPTVARKVEFK